MRPFSTSILLLSSLCSAVLVHGAPTKNDPENAVYVKWKLSPHVKPTSPPEVEQQIAKTVIHKYAASLKFPPEYDVIHCGAPPTDDTLKREFKLVSSVSETCKNIGCKVIVESLEENKVKATVYNEEGQTIVTDQLTPKDFGLEDSAFSVEGKTRLKTKTSQPSLSKHGQSWYNPDSSDSSE